MKKAGMTTSASTGAPLVAAPAGPELVAADWTSDGGAVRVFLNDARGARRTYCFDRRPGTGTPGRIYVGVGHPDAEGGRPACEMEEHLIVAQILAALGAVYSPHAQMTLLAKRYDTEVASYDHDAWLVLNQLRARGDV